MNGKTIAIIAYITFIGWIVAIILQSSAHVKESIASFHLRQSLGLFLTGIAGSIVLGIVGSMLGTAVLSQVFGLAMLVLWVLGLIAAVQGEEKPVPVVGEYYQQWFAGIK